MPQDSENPGTQRLDLVLGHTGTALRELRSTEAPGALSGIMAKCWRTYLGPKERAFLMAVGAQAAEPEDRQALHAALDPVPSCSLTAKEIKRHEACDRWAGAHARWGRRRGEWTPPPERDDFK